ncbi:unnamed protein product [Notodromas monacha]|uniref:Neurotransmitter-gated ion-channel ligand-binding domain-containing protein n=1 Tax=Notodromas monacha TaxID=399045 RepID=A0A7R9BUY1_9CRUS|nr:unnamed protein product [Notodromas monacha]CAG0920597.1 unnamed protein product [Notodromas monacha]
MPGENLSRPQSKIQLGKRSSISRRGSHHRPRFRWNTVSTASSRIDVAKFAQRGSSSARSPAVWRSMNSGSKISSKEPSVHARLLVKGAIPQYLLQESSYLRTTNFYQVVDMPVKCRLKEEYRKWIIANILSSSFLRMWIHLSVLATLATVIYNAARSYGEFDTEIDSVGLSLTTTRELFSFFLLPLVINILASTYCYPDVIFTDITLRFDCMSLTLFLVPHLTKYILFWLNDYQLLNLKGAFLSFRIINTFSFFTVTECTVRGLRKAAKALLDHLLLMLLGITIMAVIGSVLFADVSPSHFGNPVTTTGTVFYFLMLERVNKIIQEVITSPDITRAKELLFTAYCVCIIAIGAFVGIGLIESIVAASIEMEITDLERRQVALRRRQRRKRIKNNKKQSFDLRDKYSQLSVVTNDDSSSAGGSSGSLSSYSDDDAMGGYGLGSSSSSSSTSSSFDTSSAGFLFPWDLQKKSDKSKNEHEMLRQYSPTLADVVEESMQPGEELSMGIINFLHVMVTLGRITSDIATVTVNLNDILLAQFKSDRPQYRICFARVSSRSSRAELEGLLSGSYDKLQRPQADGPPVAVSLSMYIREIEEIDLHRQTMTFGMTLRYNYEDTRLKDVNANPQNLQKISTHDPEIVNRFWMPDLFVQNSLDMYNGLTQEDIILRIKKVSGASVVPYGYQAPAEIAIDGKTLLFSVNTPSKDSVDVTHVPLDVDDKYASVFSGNYTSLTVTLSMHRLSNGYIISIFVPCLCAVFLSYATLWIDPRELTPRLTLNGILLAAVWYLSSSMHFVLPRVPYPTAMDTWTGITCFLVSLAIFETIAVEKLLRGGQTMTFGMTLRYNYEDTRLKDVNANPQNPQKISTHDPEIVNRFWMPDLFVQNSLDVDFHELPHANSLVRVDTSTDGLTQEDIILRIKKVSGASVVPYGYQAPAEIAIDGKTLLFSVNTPSKDSVDVTHVPLDVDDKYASVFSELTPRLTLNGILLAAVWYLSSSMHFVLPRVPYPTAMDTWTGITCFLVSLAIFETIAVEKLLRGGQESRIEVLKGSFVLWAARIDMGIKIGIPAFFLLFNIIFWACHLI